MNYLILAAIIPAYVLVYGLIGLAYPYYSAWDSSMFFTLDALITRSGQLPDHFFHPNMIPLILNGYLFLPLGKFLGLISIDSIMGLKSLPNPYLAFVETVKYLLLLGALFAYIYVALMYLCITKILSPAIKDIDDQWKRLFTLTIVLAALTWSGLPNMLFWIRYETYGIVFWVCSLLATIKATQSANPRLWILAAGMLSGAAIFSKIQLLGGALCLPFIYFSLANKHTPIDKQCFIGTCVPLAFFIFISSSVIHYLAFEDFIHGKIITVAFLSALSSKKFIPIFPIFSLLLLAITIILGWKFHRIPNIFSTFIFNATTFLFGIFSVIFCSLLIGTQWIERKSALEVTYIYSLMLGQLDMDRFGNQANSANFNANLMPLLFFSVGILALGYLRNRNKSPLNWQQYIFSSLSILALIFSSIILLRRGEFQKDALMLDAWVLISGALLIRMYLIHFSNKKKLVVLYGCLLSLLMSLTQLIFLYSYHENTYDELNYYYQIDKWKEFSYGYRENQYVDLMNQAYPTKELWMTAFTWGKHTNDIKLLFKQMFRNSIIKISDTSLGAEGAFLDLSLEKRIKTLSPELQNSLIIPWSGNSLKIAPRSDYFTYLVTSQRDIDIKGNSKNTALQMQSLGGNTKTDYFVYELVGGVIYIKPNGSQIFIAIKPRQ